MWHSYPHRGEVFWIRDHGVTDKKRAVHDATGRHLCDFGAPGYHIRPGTSKGHNYCARSQGIPITHWRTSANYWSRQCWSCRGDRSVCRAIFFGKLRKGKPSFWGKRRKKA